MFYPPLKRKAAQQIVTSTFGGINRAEEIGDGEFARALNLSTREYPMLCPRKPRGSVRTIGQPGGLIAKDQLCWVDGNKVYYNGTAVAGLQLSTAAADWPKQLVGMGAYVVIFPDKKYFNTVDLTDCGSLEDEIQYTGTVRYTMCRLDGSDYPSAVAQDTEPENPENGDYWIDTGTTPHRLMVYSTTYGTWTQIYTVYTRIAMPGIHQHFKTGDTVEVSGVQASGAIPTGTKTAGPAARLRITDALGGAASSLKVTRTPYQTGSGTPSEWNERNFVGWTGENVYTAQGDAAPVQHSFTWPSAGTLYGYEFDLITGKLTKRYGHIASYNNESLPGAWMSSRDVYRPGTTPSQGAEVVYELAQPTTYSLTAQAVTLTRGLNTVWAEAGDVELRYGYYDTAYAAAIEQLAALNGSQYIYAHGEGWVVVIGLLDSAMTQTTGTVKISRKCPDMEYVIESENRLWGCHYGPGENGQMLNEIYACKLGDFKNWRVYQGISTDSYAVSLGSDGPFTGAIAYSGMPMFFKETCVHKIYGNQPKNYQVMTTQMRGVQQGSAGSLRNVDGTLLYMSASGVEAYDGSLPTAIGEALGDAQRENGVAGALGSRYYLKCTEDGENRIYVYDMRLNIWMEEDGADVIAFAPYEHDLYMLCGDTGELVTMQGSVGELEEQVEWLAETGLQGWESVNQKYVTRYNIRARLPERARLKCSLQYDSAGRWHEKLNVVNMKASTKTMLMPVYPKRCDHLRMRLEGAGEIKVFTIARLMTNGGDGQRG